MNSRQSEQIVVIPEQIKRAPSIVIENEEDERKESNFSQQITRTFNEPAASTTVSIVGPSAVYAATMPVLFLSKKFLSICFLPHEQWILYLSSLEPTLTTLPTVLDNLFKDLASLHTIAAGLTHPPIYLYHKYTIKRKANTLPNEESLAKMNGFLLATIFYAFHHSQLLQSTSASSSSSKNCSSSSTTSTREEEDEELYRQKKASFQIRYATLLESFPHLTEMDYYFLINFEFVVTWIYQNIFSVGKQVNQEFIIIAGMVVEGSHRILSRGGGSGNVRRLREEIYRMVSGKAKQKRMKKEKKDTIRAEQYSEHDSRFQMNEEKAMKDSPVLDDDDDGTDRSKLDCMSNSPLNKGEEYKLIACNMSGFEGVPLPSPSPSHKRSREGQEGSSDEEERSNNSFHWKKKIKYNVDNGSQDK